jgi:putative salt-induced outer membrane protein YdiY
MRKFCLLAMFPVLACSLLFADQVVMKNGDRLTGTITKSDQKNLILKTDYADDVTIQWTAIQEINSTQPLHVATQDGKTVAGPVTTSDGTLAVATTTGSVNVPKDQVTALRSDQEQAAYEKGLHPALWQGWAGGVTVGFALTGGNSETKSLALAFTGDRKTTHDEITMYENTVYATNDAPGAVPGVTANTNQGGARYSRDFTTRLFGYGSADFQTNALQFLNLRSILGGGLGVHVINSSQTTLDLLGGLNYTHESYGAIPTTATLAAQPPISRGFAALSVGEELMHKLGASTVLTEKGYFFPELTNPSGQSGGQYRATFNFGTVTKLSKWLGWQNAFGDIYVTNPPVGTKKNDILLTTGLNVTFTH